MTTPTVERDETNPQEADRLMGRSVMAILPYEYEKAQSLLVAAECAAGSEPDMARRAIALAAVAGGFIELGRVYGWGMRS